VLEIREVMAAINKKPRRSATRRTGCAVQAVADRGREEVHGDEQGGARAGRRDQRDLDVLEVSSWRPPRTQRTLRRFEAGLAKLKDLYASNPQAQKFIQDKEAILQKMKGTEVGRSGRFPRGGRLPASPVF